MSWITSHGWQAVLWSHEGRYYRPLPFVIYKWASVLFPLGIRQTMLHLVSLSLYLLNTALVVEIGRLCCTEDDAALLAGILFSVFPFWANVVPWITAMPHLLVTSLTLLSAYFLLEAKESRDQTKLFIGFIAAIIAPLAHESGVVSGLIVAGVLLVRYGMDSSWLWGTAVSIGSVIGALFVLMHEKVSQVGGGGLLAGARTPFHNIVYALNGLLYPISPLVAKATQSGGWNSFASVILITFCLVFLFLVWSSIWGHNWPWVVQSLWWWGVGLLPALVSLSYGGLFISPRVYALSSVGVALFWSNSLEKISNLLPTESTKRFILIFTTGAIVIQSVYYINRERSLYLSLNSMYQKVLSASADSKNWPIGFVNLPSGLEYQKGFYGTEKDRVLFIPYSYSNIKEFIQVNRGLSASADAVMFGQLYQKTNPIVVGQGPWLQWEQIRQFVERHHTIWLTRYDRNTHRFKLEYVGSLTPRRSLPKVTPLARFKGGPILLYSSVREIAPFQWAITLVWYASKVSDANVFVHVLDSRHNIVTQADGAALGRMVPLYMWQQGDLLRDVRYVSLRSKGRYVIVVGLFRKDGQRLPAYSGIGNKRYSYDAVPVAAISP